MTYRYLVNQMLKTGMSRQDAADSARKILDNVRVQEAK